MKDIYLNFKELNMKSNRVRWVFKTIIKIYLISRGLNKDHKDSLNIIHLIPLIRQLCLHKINKDDKDD